MKICPLCATEYGDDVRFCKNDGSALRAHGPATDLVGQIVAERYHIVRKLGEGGMGQVYLAEHVKMGRPSAIKVMHPSMVHDPDAVARFNREAANASRITHPNVCAIYDFGETPDGLIYLAMEFIEGEPLTALLDREGVLPAERAGRIFLQTADALQTAHELGIVHRDLKPDNIMIARGRHGEDFVKVVDFGIAKAVGGEPSQNVTKTGLVVGTPEFMSPEQLSGDSLDGRSDLYSLALVLFRMLTGRLPFQAETVQETMVQRLTEDPLSLAAARPDLAVPPGLQRCLDTALARRPANRYRGVAKFAADMAAILGLEERNQAAGVPPTRGGDSAKTELLEPVPARRAPTRPAAPPPVAAGAPPRNRALTVAGIVGLVGLGAGAAVVWSARGGSAPDTPAPTRGAAAETLGSPAPVAPPTMPSTIPALDAARASTLLDDLFDAVTDTVRRTAGTLRTARDSARHIFEALGVHPDDRAFAAYVVANAYAVLDDRRGACEWARRAATTSNPVAAYTALERALCGS